MTHRHVVVNGSRVVKPSFRLPPRTWRWSWESLRATLARRPRREEVPVVCDEQLVVEYYSR